MIPARLRRVSFSGTGYYQKHGEKDEKQQFGELTSPLIPELRSPTRSLSSLLFPLSSFLFPLINFIQQALDFARAVVPTETRTTVVTLLDGSVVAP